MRAVSLLRASSLYNGHVSALKRSPFIQIRQRYSNVYASTLYANAHTHTHTVHSQILIRVIIRVENGGWWKRGGSHLKCVYYKSHAGCLLYKGGDKKFPREKQKDIVTRREGPGSVSSSAPPPQSFQTRHVIAHKPDQLGLGRGKEKRK